MFLLCLGIVGGWALCSSYSAKIVKEQKKKNIFQKESDIK